MQPSFKKIIQPLIYGVLIALGIYIGTQLNSSLSGIPNPLSNNNGGNSFNKINDVISYIKQEYVDTVNQENLVDNSIEKLLETLDPHSSYIRAEDLKSVNEPLEGNFEGIGIEFHIQSDTIMVVSTISGGPSEMVGLKPGDRLVFVDGKNVAGIGITNQDVFKKLRGTGGTKVKLKVRRNNVAKLLDFTIVRGKIPIKSIDVSFMVDDKIGYIKISRFAATTYDEYMEAFTNLKKAGMQKLIIDVRGNPGGYLDAATMLADEFLPDKKLLVYTQGKSRQRSNHYATSEGMFETGKLFVLIDEGSASAAEILAGALQDWDRAEIIGRRSFGKGLVQEQTMFPDGSGMRLTVARYYTPTGRCIQKPYTDGIDEYNEDLNNRFKHGELGNADSVHFADTVKYKTPAGKIVYGGGGIMPDVFIPIDTTDDNEFTRAVFGLGLVSQFCYDYVDKHRSDLSVYKTAKQFAEQYQLDAKIKSDFIAYAIKGGAKPDEKLINASQSLITSQLKATLARLLFGNDGFYPVLLKNDNTFLRAVEDAKK